MRGAASERLSCEGKGVSSGDLRGPAVAVEMTEGRGSVLAAFLDLQSPPLLTSEASSSRLDTASLV